MASLEVTLLAAMMTIVVGLLSLLWLAHGFLVCKPGNPTWLPNEKEQPAKHEFEKFVLCYSPLWIAAFAVVVASGMYERFTEHSYMALCVTLAAPLLLEPLIQPCCAERSLPLLERYSVKANIWIGLYSFIGNYLYTHYFYTVLRARYSMPSWRLNDVPIPLYFATHFYFFFYHTAANLILRRICTGYEPTRPRAVFLVMTVLTMSYITAFMEALTISGFPYYSFEDVFMAWTVGSVFYGFYFVVSYPMFFRMDEDPKRPFSPFQTVLECLASCMAITLLLDIVRLMLGIEFRMGGKMLYCADCKVSQG